MAPAGAISSVACVGSLGWLSTVNGGVNPLGDPLFDAIEVVTKLAKLSKGILVFFSMRLVRPCRVLLS